MVLLKRIEFHTHVVFTFFFIFSMTRGPPISTLFPYTTLFRSLIASGGRVSVWDRVSTPAVKCTLAFSSAAASRSQDRKSTRLNSSHQIISYAVFCLKKKRRE